MNTDSPVLWIAFAGSRRIAAGEPPYVAAKVKEFAEQEPTAHILIFDKNTSRRVELDLRGSLADALRQMPQVSSAPATNADVRATGPKSPGRPKLGVKAREVTLLPRHWKWLASQPGGASAALRTLVEAALRTNRENDRIRRARGAAYGFMSAVAGNEPGFEEAARALFAGDYQQLVVQTRSWPADVREHALSLASVAEKDTPPG